MKANINQCWDVWHTSHTLQKRELLVLTIVLENELLSWKVNVWVSPMVLVMLYIPLYTQALLSSKRSMNRPKQIS